MGRFINKYIVIPNPNYLLIVVSDLEPSTHFSKKVVPYAMEKLQSGCI